MLSGIVEAYPVFYARNLTIGFRFGEYLSTSAFLIGAATVRERYVISAEPTCLTAQPQPWDTRRHSSLPEVAPYAGSYEPPATRGIGTSPSDPSDPLRSAPATHPSC